MEALKTAPALLGSVYGGHRSLAGHYNNGREGRQLL